MPPTVTQDRPPPLSNYSKWFDFYDSDNSATIDKAELTSALIETTGAETISDINSIRETVNFVFEIFDSDGSNSIDRNEFCVSGGLGESLLAAICQLGGGDSRWQCKSCQFFNFPGVDGCAVCGAVGPSSSSSTGRWACERCSYENGPNNDTCEMCAGSRPVPRTEPTPPPRQNQEACSWESPWACERCSYENTGRDRCEMCDGEKPVRPLDSTPSQEARKPRRSDRSSRSKGSSTSSAGSDSNRLKIQPWQCPDCGFNNTKKNDFCEMCREDRTSANNVETERLPFPQSTPPPPETESRSLGKMRRPRSSNKVNGSWDCETCNFSNPPDKSECLMCRAKTLAQMGSQPLPTTRPQSDSIKGQSRRRLSSTKIKIPWECAECNFMCAAETYECDMCQAPRPRDPVRDTPTRDTSTRDTSTRPERPERPFRRTKLRTVRASVPPDGYPGQNVKVKVGGVVHRVVVPERSSWVYPSNDDAPQFEAKVCVDVTEQKQPQSSRSLKRSYNKGGGAMEDWVGFECPSGPTTPDLTVTRVPICLAPIRVSGRLRSLIIGINYTNTRAQLEGCINDARNVKTMLARNGYPTDTSHMVMLTDDNKYDNGRYLPTGKNILKAMRWLVQGASPGDIMFFHFSGHGAQVPDKTGQESDGLNETILPMDYKKRVIVDDEMWGGLVQPLPSGTKLIAVMDCCHSGTGLDLPFEYKRSSRLKGGKWIEEINPAHSCGDVVLFSGCEDDQQSADVQDTKKEAGGAMTYAFRKALEKYPKGTTYTTFMDAIQKSLKKHGMKNQRPQLTSSQKFDVDKKIFSLTDGIEPNGNEKVGRLMRRRIKPGKVVNDLPINGDIDEFLFGNMGSKIANIISSPFH